MQPVPIYQIAKTFHSIPLAIMFQESGDEHSVYKLTHQGNLDTESPSPAGFLKHNWQ
jgi:hypothetical protein